MKTKQNKQRKNKKNTKQKKTKGSGVGVYQQKFDAIKAAHPTQDTFTVLYTQLLHSCTFRHLSSGSYGYTYIATHDPSNDFGFRNEKNRPVHQFLVKVVPLDYEKSLESSVYALAGHLHYPGVVKDRSIQVSVGGTEMIRTLDTLRAKIGTRVTHRGEIGVIDQDRRGFYLRFKDRDEGIDGTFVPDILIEAGNTVEVNIDGNYHHGDIIGAVTMVQFNTEIRPVLTSNVVSAFYMRQTGTDKPVHTTSYLEAKREFNLQKRLYRNGLTSRQELCPSPMYIYSSSIKMLPPSLLANLEFAFNEEFTKRIENEHNPFRVSVFVMELFGNSLTLYDVIHDDWIELATADTPETLKTRDPRYAWKKQMLDIIRSSTQLCVDAGFVGDTEAIIQEACLLRIDRKYTSTCVSLLLSRLRRHVLSIYKHGVSHADFSLSNCLINTEGKITFIDYGMSTKMSDEEIATFRGLDQIHQVQFVINSCEFPNYRNYKWLFKNAYDDQRRGSLDKTPVPIAEIDTVLIAPESTIVLFHHKDVKGFAEGVVMLT